MLLRRIVVPVLAMLAGLLAVPAAADPTDGILLRGSRTAWVDVTVYVNTTIVPADVTMTTRGSYVGFFLSPAPANRDTIGALAMPSTFGTQRFTLGESWDVRAGRYRMFLITDGAAEVFVPIEGQGFRGWTPRGSAPTSVRRLAFDVAAGASGGTRDLPVAPRARSLVVAAAAATSSSLTAVDQLTTCVAPAASCVAGLRAPTATVYAASASLAPAGSYQASFAVTRTGGVDAGSHVTGVVLMVSIGRQT